MPTEQSVEAPERGRPILIRDATAITMAPPGEVLTHVDIAIAGHRLTSIEPTGGPAPAGARIVDGRGRVALPGFVNAHNHVGLGLMKASSEAMPLEAWLAWLLPHQGRMGPEDVYWSALLACAEQTRHGITTFADMLGRQDWSAPAVEASGLRAVLSQSVMERDPLGPDPTEGLRRLETSVEFALAWNGRSGGRITTRLAPHSVYTVRPELLRAFAERAAEAGLGIQVHCSETRAEVDGCRTRHGCTPPALLERSGCLEVPILLAHGVHLSDEDLALIDHPWVGLSHNPASNLKLQSGLARLPELVGRRLAVGLGTDSAASNDCQDPFREWYLAAVLHAWPAAESPSWRVLELATIGGARALGLADEIGSLEVGKRADVVLVELDGPRLAPGHDPVRQLAYCGRGDDVVTTIVDGEILLDERALCRLDPRQIARECRERAARLLSA